MNTNDSQFLKAYNDLVSAFFNFMNVVSPQDRQQNNLSYVASQLNQLLDALTSTQQTVAPIGQQPPSPTLTEVPVQNPVEEEQTPPVQVPTFSENPQKPTFNAANAKTMYCAYPELVNGRYKFKSGMISEEPGEDSVYQLLVDENIQTGFVEIRELTGELLKIVANNPSLYTPLGVCPEAGCITVDRQSVTSASKLPLVKAVRGWEIAEGEKFKLTVS